MSIFDNTASSEIRLTEDRLRWITHTHVTRIGNRMLFMMPLTLLVTIVLGITTTDTKAAFGVPKETWSALWLIAAVGCAAWFIACIFRYNCRSVTFEDFIAECKQGPADD